MEREKFLTGSIKGEYPLSVWAKHFNNGCFDSESVSVQIDAGWYDKFCADRWLKGKTRKLGKKLLEIIESPLIWKDYDYVFFKNVCPCVGPLYDQFSICSIETGNVLYCFCKMKNGCHGNDFSGWQVWDFVKGESEPVVEGSWKDVRKYFKLDD